MKNPRQKTSKFQDFISFIFGEMILFGSSYLIALLGILDPLSTSAQFLATSITTHLLAGYDEIKAWKKAQKKLSGYLR